MNAAIVRLAAAGLELPPDNVRPFDYAAPLFDDVAAVSGATPGQATQTINIQGQHFACFQRSFSCIVNATLTARPNVLVQILDTGTGENQQSAFVPIWTVFGDAYQPYILPVPRVYAPNTSISITIQNFESSTIDVRLVLNGCRVFA